MEVRSKVESNDPDTQKDFKTQSKSRKNSSIEFYKQSNFTCSGEQLLGESFGRFSTQSHHFAFSSFLLPSSFHLPTPLPPPPPITE